MILIVILLLSLAYGLTVERIPSTNPPPSYRSFSLMESYTNQGIIIVYGGFADPSSIFGDVWLFNTKDEVWNKIVPSNGAIPVGRYNGGSFKSKNEELFYIFGGLSLTGPLNDLWCFQTRGILWYQIQASGDVPLPRLRFGFTSYQDRDGTLLFAIFGGLTVNDSDNNLYM